VIGALSPRGEVALARRVDQVCKLEGLAVAPAGGEQLALFLVADPDDRARRAPLYRAALT
jgi:hypothetical protein